MLEAINAADIPLELKRTKQWLLWEYVENNKKVPLQLAASKYLLHRCEAKKKVSLYISRGSANDSANFATFDDALQIANGLRRWGANVGIGYALTNDAQIIAFDFDDVLDARGAFTDSKVEAVISNLATYAEISPSGTGVRAFVGISASLKEHISTTIKSWASFKTTNDAKRHTVFVAAGFVTVTGNKLAKYAQTFNAQADEFMRKWFALRYPNNSTRSTHNSSTSSRASYPATNSYEPDLDDNDVNAQVLDALGHIDADCDRDTWVKIGMVLHKLSKGDERGLKLWDKWSLRAPYRYPKGREPTTTKLYRSFDAHTTKAVSLGTLLHFASLADNNESREAVKLAKERLQRTITNAKDTLGALVKKRGVSTIPVTLSKEGLDIVPMSSLPTEATRWLWTHVVPFGHLTLVSGAVSSGKSTFLLKLAADTSHARPLPYDIEREKYLQRLDKEFGNNNKYTRPYTTSGIVYYLTSEMHWTQTAVPTLRRCGAKEDNIFFMRRSIIRDKNGNERMRPFDLVTDLDKLIKHIVATQCIPDLIVLDPITSFMGTQIDRNAESDVRTILELMADFCASIGIAFIGVLHQNKSLEQSGVGKLLGSMAFGAVARVVLFVWPCDAEDSGEREKHEWEQQARHFGVTIEKSNIGPTDTAHVFRLSASDRLGLDVQYVGDKPVRDFLRERLRKQDKEAAPKRDEITKFITSECVNKAHAFDSKHEAHKFIADKLNCSVPYVQRLVEQYFDWAPRAAHDDGSVKWQIQRRQLN